MRALSIGVVFAVALLLCPLPGRATGTQVGVIMGSEGCPGGVAPLYIHIDNEDNNNQNGRGGWIGATVSDRNTTFQFCRVSGDLFQPVGQPYMVLSLGFACPIGSQTIRRTFDGEDRRSRSSTNIDGLAEGLSRPIVAGSNVNMYFCLFHGFGFDLGPLPSIGVEYGVFAAADFAPAFGSGYVYLDDEDSLLCWGCGINANSWCEDTSWQQFPSRVSESCDPRATESGWSSPYRSYGDGSYIMDGGLNSRLNIVRAQGPRCGNGRCVAGESCSSCPQDCGACPVCGDFICNGFEHCGTCPLDCGICAITNCGDGLCSGAESCSSCCVDCGTCVGEWECDRPIDPLDPP
jgi:hypothetical protein